MPNNAIDKLINAPLVRSGRTRTILVWRHLKRLRSTTMEHLQKLREHPRIRALEATLGNMVNYGIDGYPPHVQRRLKIMNLFSYLIALFTTIYIVPHFFVDFELWKPVIIINLLLIAAALCVPLLHRFNEIAGALMITIAECVAMFVIISYLGRSSGVQLQYVAAAAAPFVILGLERMKLIVAIIATAFCLHLIAWFMFPGDVDLTAVSGSQLNSIYVNAAITTFGIVAMTVYYGFRLAEEARAETDALLRNILPEQIVDRLKKDPSSTIADNIVDASVLFSDLKGFVTIAKSLGPDRTVQLLNILMKKFDELADKHGVEKIKTIGDAYMVAAGVPSPQDDHAERLVRLGADMIAASDQIAIDENVPLQMRIGIASGPMMAGVIGARRLNYDIWGDTVNLAARLESTGEVGRLHVSESVRAHVGDIFPMSSRGPLEIKGFGSTETYFVD